MLIAARKLLVRSTDQNTQMEIRLFLPSLVDETWTCHYEIDWPTGTKDGFAAGVDAVQAIILAIQRIGAELYTSIYHRNAELVWERPDAGYGFLVPSNLRDLLKGDDAKL
jgi:hypothetical protein